MKNLGQIMKQVQDMQTHITKMQEKMTAQEITNAAGNGMVQATVNNKSKLKHIKIDPSLIIPTNIEILENLIVTTINNTKSKTNTINQAKMAKLTNELPLPPDMWGGQCCV